MKLQEMEFCSLNVVIQIPYCTIDPFHKLLLAIEVVLESNDNYANDTIVQMICLSVNVKINITHY